MNNFLESVKSELVALAARKTLLEQLIATYDETAIKEVEEIGKPTSGRKCSKCGKVGHKSTTCPEGAVAASPKKEKKKYADLEAVISDIKKLRESGASKDEAKQELGLSTYMIEKYW